LATSEIDLLNVYTEFRDTPAGRDVGMNRFLRLPMRCVYEVVKIESERKKRQANIDSISTARLTGVVLAIAQSFSKEGKSQPIPLDQLLPYPLDEDASTLMAETKEIYKKLLAQRKLPIHVIGGLSKVIST
tara:strand:- start:329 stop:721 length:393 start_codon:yes stop_codon:yes gene_type:complete